MERLTWQENEVGLWPKASKKLKASVLPRTGSRQPPKAWKQIIPQTLHKTLALANTERDPEAEE